MAKGKKKQPNFYGMFSQFRFHCHIENNATTMQRNQRAHTAKAEPILWLIWFIRLLFGHFRTKTNLLLTEIWLVRLPHHLIQLENNYFLHPRTVCIIIYRAVILDFMKISAILNHQALVNRKFILNLLQNGQIYNSSRKSEQQNTYYLDLLYKKNMHALS